MVAQTEEEHGEGVSLQLIEYGQEIGSAYERENAGVADYPDEVNEGGHDAPEDHHQYCEVLVHSLEQTVEGQREDDQDQSADEVGDDAEAEEPLMSGDVVCSRGGVSMHEEFSGDVHEAHGAQDAQ